MPVGGIASSIFLLRGHKVLLDADLASLYGVTTGRLNEQVRRNRARFPADFLLGLTAEEFSNLKSHFATSSWGGRDVYQTIRSLMGVAPPKRRPIGFTADLRKYP